MTAKLLDSQSFSKILKTAARQKILCNGVKIWPRNIIRGPLREHILFAHPTNFTAGIEKKLHRLFGATTYDNVKSVIVWNASFRLASLGFDSKIQVETIRSQCFGGHHV